MLKKNILVGMCVFFLGLSTVAYAADTEVILEDDTLDSGFAVKNSSGETTIRAGGDGNVEVSGRIKVGDSAATPTAGTIRWTGSDFEGYDGTQWVSLTSAGGGGGGITECKTVQNGPTTGSATCAAMGMFCTSHVMVFSRGTREWHPRGCEGNIGPTASGKPVFVRCCK